MKCEISDEASGKGSLNRDILAQEIVIGTLIKPAAGLARSGGGNLPRQVRGRACAERSMQCEGFRTSRRRGRLTAAGLRPRLRGSNSSGQRSMPMRSSRDAAMQGLAGLRARRVGELEASVQRICPHAHAYLCVRLWDADGHVRRHRSQQQWEASVCCWQRGDTYSP